MLRKLGRLLAALLVAAAIGDSLVWFVVVRQMRSDFGDWAAAQRAAGWSVTSAVPEAGGWPLAATLILRDVAVQGGAAVMPDGMDWKAGRVVLRLTPRHPRVLQIAAGGAQFLRLSQAPGFAYTARHLRVLVPLQAPGPNLKLALQAEQMRIGTATPTGGDALSIAHLAANAVLDPAAGHGQAVATVSARADGIGLPPRLGWALGPRMGSFRLDAALDGPLPHAVGLTAAATAWRDHGGSLVLRRVATEWGPLGLSATGTLHLDARLQPACDGQAQVTGFAATLAALARHGLMSHTAAITATALLSLMAETPPGGGPPAVSVPLSLHGGILSMQQIPLLRVPPLDWPPAG